MGNAGGSMFWMFGIVIVVYIVGMSLYQLYLWIKKRLSKRGEQS